MATVELQLHSDGVFSGTPSARGHVAPTSPHAYISWLANQFHPSCRASTSFSSYPSHAVLFYIYIHPFAFAKKERRIIHYPAPISFRISFKLIFRFLKSFLINYSITRNHKYGNIFHLQMEHSVGYKCFTSIITISHQWFSIAWL